MVRVRVRVRVRVSPSNPYQVSMGTFVVPDNGVDCLNGCQTFDLGYEQRSDDYLMGGHIINAPRNDGNQDGKRLGLETPAWYRLARG